MKEQTWTRVGRKEGEGGRTEGRGRGGGRLLQSHMGHGKKLDLAVGLVWEDYEPWDE